MILGRTHDLDVVTLDNVNDSVLKLATDVVHYCAEQPFITDSPQHGQYVSR
jgi:hypothetical protein